MIYGYFQRWTKQNIWQTINDYLRSKLRQLANKEESPSVAIIDSQSVKTTQKKGARGYDAGKKIKGRKRHIAVDTLGLLLVVSVHCAGIVDTNGAYFVLRKMMNLFPRLSLDMGRWWV